jgi:hypothetical protein
LAGIDVLLERADEQLTAAERARLRVAIEYRHGDWEGIAHQAPVLGFAIRFVSQLADAEVELSPEEVRQLEARIGERLPENPPPSP